jgi:hypothetical protein
MRFIKEMIMKKSQSSSLTEAIDADMRELRAEQHSDDAPNVTDFTDLVADINPEATEERTLETDEDITAIFNEDDDEPGWENEDTAEAEFDDEEEEYSEAEYDDLETDDPESDDDVEDLVVPLSVAPDVRDAGHSEQSETKTQFETADVADDNAGDAPARKIWDLHADLDDENETDVTSIQTSPPPEPTIVEVPAPAIGRAGRRAGRVKTRLLGFENAQGTDVDLFDPSQKAEQADEKFPVGWIVVSHGPGRGSSFSLFNGVSQIGRGEDQVVKLDFGDTSISRSNHAAIAYDSEQSAFFLGHGGKANLVRLNDRPVLSTEELSNGDLIRIGETTLRFVALCGAEFDWERDTQEDADDAAIA